MPRSHAEEADPPPGSRSTRPWPAAVERSAGPTVETPARPLSRRRSKPRFRDRLGKARTLFGGYMGSILSREDRPQTWDELEEA
jgi:hypothetical protein